MSWCLSTAKGNEDSLSYPGIAAVSAFDPTSTKARRGGMRTSVTPVTASIAQDQYGMSKLCIMAHERDSGGGNGSGGSQRRRAVRYLSGHSVSLSSKDKYPYQQETYDQFLYIQWAECKFVSSAAFVSTLTLVQGYLEF
jgi:hypothetical protein